jgi:hypothetical protein
MRQAPMTPALRQLAEFVIGEILGESNHDGGLASYAFKLGDIEYSPHL